MSLAASLRSSTVPGLIRCWFAVLCGAVLCGAAWSRPLVAQPLATPPDAPRERGLPVLTNIAPADYGGHTQNWDWVQDPRGFVYVANGNGVLEYDGTRWRTIGNSMMRDLDVAPDSTVYASGRADVGYLAPDSTGALQYVSLVHHIPEAQRPQDSFVSVGVEPDGSHVYYAWRDLLYVWDGTEMSIVRGSEHFPDAERVWFYMFHRTNDALYLAGRPHPLVRLDDGVLHPLPSHGSEAAGTVITDLFWHDAAWHAIAANDRGIFRFDGTRLRPADLQLPRILASEPAPDAVALPDGSVAFGTWNAGGVLLDPNGHVQSRLDRAAGLQNAVISGVARDRSGSLWMFLNNGIAHARTADPVTLFDSRLGLNGSVADIHRHTDGRLYATTERGLFQLVPARDTSAARFRQIGPTIEAWGMTSVEGALWVTASDGLYRVSKATLRNPSQRADALERVAAVNAYLVHRSASHPWLLHVATVSGYRTLDLRERPWTVSTPHPDAPFLGRSLAEAPDGTVWMGTYNATVYRIRLTADGTPRLTAFGADAGLPNGNADVDRIGGRPVVSTAEGFFRFDEATQRFVPAERLRAAVPDPSGPVEVAFETTGGDVVAALGDQPEMAVDLLRRQSNGTYARDPSPLAAVPRGSFHIVHTDADSSTVWIGGAFGVARYDAAASHERPPLQTHLRAARSADSVLVAGGERRLSRPVLPASTDRMTFEVAVPAMPGLPPPRYSFRLDGFETEWSTPMPDAQREYTNLAPGAYTLRARATLADGRTSTPVAYAFSVEAPWYRTAWAIALYVVLFAGLVAGATRYLSHLRLRQRVRALETERRLQNERERISRDLHDHVGAQLSNIKSGLELVRLAASAGRPTQARKHLHTLDDDVDLTMSQLRDTIWALHGPSITLQELGQQVERFLDRQTRYRDRPTATWHVEADPEQTLSPIQGLHVFRVIQEAVNNALKHANADALAVRLSETEEQTLTIVVQDDGVGFPCAPHEANGGYGLENLKARAEELDTTVEISSDAPTGTSVRLTVPIADAAPSHA